MSGAPSVQRSLRHSSLDLDNNQREKSARIAAACLEGRTSVKGEGILMVSVADRPFSRQLPALVLANAAYSDDWQLLPVSSCFDLQLSAGAQGLLVRIPRQHQVGLIQHKHQLLK